MDKVKFLLASRICKAARTVYHSIEMTALNSAFSNERDLGAFFYWAPKEKSELFSSMVRDNFKGSGDYGVFGFGVFNGQIANKAEQNNGLHTVARISYPFKYKVTDI